MDKPKISQELESLLDLIISPVEDNFQLAKLLLPNYNDELNNYLFDLNQYLENYRFLYKSKHNRHIDYNITKSTLLEIYGFYKFWFPNIPFACIDIH